MIMSNKPLSRFLLSKVFFTFVTMVAEMIATIVNPKPSNVNEEETNKEILFLSKTHSSIEAAQRTTIQTMKNKKRLEDIMFVKR